MGEIKRPLRWMSVAYSSEPSRATARFWIRAPVTVSVLSTTFVRVSIVVMVPASRAQMYMRASVGWNATPIRVRVAASITYTPR